MLKRHKVVTRGYVIKTFLEHVIEIIASEMCNKLQLKGSKIQDKIMFLCQLNKKNYLQIMRKNIKDLSFSNKYMY